MLLQKSLFIGFWWQNWPKTFEGESILNLLNSYTKLSAENHLVINIASLYSLHYKLTGTSLSFWLPSARYAANASWVSGLVSSISLYSSIVSTGITSSSLGGSSYVRFVNICKTPHEQAPVLCTRHQKRADWSKVCEEPRSLAGFLSVFLGGQSWCKISFWARALFQKGIYLNPRM